MSGVCSSSLYLPWATGTPTSSSFFRRRECIHPHPEWCRAGPGSQEPNRCPTLSCVDPPGRVPGAPLVPIQQPKARLAALKYPARRPGLVGTSQGRLGRAGAPGRGRGWEMQEAGLVSLSGVQINGRFRSLGAAEPAPGSLKNQESTKKHRGAGRKEIRKAKNRAKSSS